MRKKNLKLFQQIVKSRELNNLLINHKLFTFVATGTPAHHLTRSSVQLPVPPYYPLFIELELIFSFLFSLNK